MTIITTKRAALKRKSPDRPQSLILYVPAGIRDIMDFEHGTEIDIEVCLEDNEKVLRIRKVD